MTVFSVSNLLVRLINELQKKGLLMITVFKLQFCQICEIFSVKRSREIGKHEM